jgi:cob(I)alamin adenosyltransferase
MPIYTRVGDKGETNLLDGRKVLKDDPRIEACGSVDELNAIIGLVIAYSDDVELKELLMKIQRDLFVIGAELAGGKQIRTINSQKIADLEKIIDEIDEKLPPLRHFILPGGTKTAALLHVARTVCRRVERRVVALANREKINRNIEIYLNRLSDLFFVLARAENRKKRIEEPVWRQYPIHK